MAATLEDGSAPSVASPAATHVLAIDVDNSRIHALGAKVTAEHDVFFKASKGELRLANGQVVGLDVTVAMPLLTSDHPRLTSHLMKPDFFAVADFPVASFHATRLTAQPGAGTTHSVTGDLTIRGKTQRITFPARIDVSTGGAAARAEFVINRQDFDVTYPGAPDNLVQDNVVLTIDLVASQPRQL